MTAADRAIIDAALAWAASRNAYDLGRYPRSAYLAAERRLREAVDALPARSDSGAGVETASGVRR